MGPFPVQGSSWFVVVVAAGPAKLFRLAAWRMPSGPEVAMGLPLKMLQISAKGVVGLSVCSQDSISWVTYSSSDPFRLPSYSTAVGPPL